MTMFRTLLLVGAAGLLSMTGVRAADHVLSGAVTSTSGQKLEGVTVYARMDGSTITTSVYTDEGGNYYFPPLPGGTYRVWAQALGFELASSTLTLNGAQRKDLSLPPMTDPERRVLQMPSEMLAAALPDATPHDARMKKVFLNYCTACHTTNYALQFKFDEAGWNRIIEFMKVIGSGAYVEETARTNPVIDLYQKELAAYLARARGPGETSMKFTPRPRPTGEAARVVWKIYNLPVNPNFEGQAQDIDGTDWTQGAASNTGHHISHDGLMSLDGNLYYTVSSLNDHVTAGKVDGRTGKVTYLKVDRPNGKAASSHGIALDAKGNIWLDVDTGRRGLGKIDPTTDRITVYQTPSNMPPVGGAVTIDVDGQQKVWASSPAGVLRFDPQTETFTYFASQKSAGLRGSNLTYGAAGDREGKGWWAQMAIDAIGVADTRTGEVSEVVVPPVRAEMDRFARDKAFFDTFNATLNVPFPWGQGSRRMGTDKAADVLWVGNSWGSTLARIDTRTRETTLIPMPDPVLQPYHIAVDKEHNAWGNLWTSDQIFRYDPAARRFSFFDLPVHGSEFRHISLLERNGVLNVVGTSYRHGQILVMTPRTPAELAALRTR
jgi:streptogramin lyase